jgi:hypothetical protein
MDAILIWPGQKVLSLLVLWGLSAIFLWAAREPMLQLIRGLGRSLEQGVRALAEWCSGAARELRERNRESLLAAGTLELQSKLDREFGRIEAGFAQRLGQYDKIHRRLDEVLVGLDADYRRCGEAPPEVPGWTNAVESIAQLPASADPNVQKVLEGIRKSLAESEKKALQSYREDSSRRHKILAGLVPMAKQLRDLMARVKDVVASALETTTRVEGYYEAYSEIRDDQEKAARARTYSAVKLFLVSLVVLGVALGGAFINFQLIALPMSELVPAGARIGGVPVSTVSALVIVLMEAAVGLFAMDMLGITELFPRLASVPASRRRLILGVSLTALLFLASVESSLAILREKIVEADAALKLALAASDSVAIAEASSSSIPVIGQAVLGFVLPWILALMAVPLEMLLDSGRHVAAAFAAALLAGASHLARAVAHALGTLTGALAQVYDVYISIPLRIERAVRGGGEPATSPAAPGRAPVRREGVRREGVA